MKDLDLWDDYFRDIEKMYDVKIHKYNLKVYVGGEEFYKYWYGTSNSKQSSVGSDCLTYTTGYATYHLLEQDSERIEIPLSEYIQLRSQ